MPYVTRDADGRVVALARTPLDDRAEELPADDAEVVAFVERLGSSMADAEPVGTFLASDLAFIRVMEDVIEVLIRKGVLALSDLPGPAQDKLMGRRALRGWLAGVVGVADDDGGKVI